VLKARKTNVELLLSNHPDDCLYCERSGSCELQSLSEDLNIRERRITGKKSQHKTDRSSPAIVLDPSKCILCGRCVRICEEIMSTSALDFAYRGNELRISAALDKPLGNSNCTACGQCLMACPTGALIENVQFPQLEALLHAPGKMVVVQYTPAVAVSVAELLGYKPGTDLGSLVHTVLRRHGCDYVFETSTGADVMIVEQARILEERKGKGESFPLITSSCPAWVQFVEQYYPELIPSLSPLKSPQQLAGSLIRNWIPELIEAREKEIVSVVISSCTAAKSEARREEMMGSGVPEVDLVLTTRELARLIRLSGLELDQLEREPFSDLFHSECTAGKLAAVAGGEAEATLRTLYHRITGKEVVPSKLHRFRINRSTREITLKAGRKEFRVASVSGLSHAVELLEEIRSGKKQVDFLEIMACPQGCVNGGGQPLPVDHQMVRNRTRAIYETDNEGSVQMAHQNPVVSRIYSDFLGEPGSRYSKEYLFTSFKKRDVLL